jgi:hypothetical protein
MGCQVALEWCRQHAGSRLEGVALILGTPQYSLRTVMFGSRALGDVAAHLLDTFQNFWARVWEVTFAWTFCTSYVGHTLARALGVIRIPYTQFAPFYRHMKRLHGGSYNRMLVTGQRHTAMDVLERLDRREVPTLIVTGGKDFSVNGVVVKEMHFAAPRASFVHLPDACHAGMIGEREAVTEALEQFLHEKRESAAFNRRRLYDATGLHVSPPESPVTGRHRGSHLAVDLAHQGVSDFGDQFGTIPDVTLTLYDYFTIISVAGASRLLEVPAPSLEQRVERALLHRGAHRLSVRRRLVTRPSNGSPPRPALLVHHRGERSSVGCV